MKKIIFSIALLSVLGCSEKKSEMEKMQDQIEEQNELIKKQDEKISNLEDNTSNVPENSISPEQPTESSYSLNLNINLADIISFEKQETGNIEDFLIKKNWVFIEKVEKKAFHFKGYILKYRNSFSDTEIIINIFEGSRNITFKTKNQENFKKILDEMQASNFSLKNSDYDGGKSFDLSNPEVGKERIIDTSAKLYSNGKIKITTNLNTYATVNRVLNDSEGTYNYSENSKYLSYEISVD